jgi:PAS domain S-box-containing protein
VWETDGNGVVITDSPSWRAYTGQTLDEWLGYGWLNAIHPGDRSYAELQWREAITARGLVNAEFRLRSPDRAWRWTNIRAAPVIDADGAIEKWVGINIDIDDRKRAEAALRDSEQRYRTLFDNMAEGLTLC